MDRGSHIPVIGRRHLGGPHDSSSVESTPRKQTAKECITSIDTCGKHVILLFLLSKYGDLDPTSRRRVMPLFQKDILRYRALPIRP